MTALIVAGSAPCVFEDLDAVRLLFPDADVMTINEACGAIENIQHMLAGHTVKAEAFWQYRQEKFPFWIEPIRVHANWHRLNEAPKREYPCVTNWWGGAVSSGATSAGKAIRIGMAMEYAPIILAGCPMNGGGYYNQADTERFDKPFWKHGKCTRVGDDSVQSHRSIVRYRDKFAELAEQEWQGKVFSMSGFTRKVLGAPTGA